MTERPNLHTRTWYGSFFNHQPHQIRERAVTVGERQMNCKLTTDSHGCTQMVSPDQCYGSICGSAGRRHASHARQTFACRSVLRSGPAFQTSLTAGPSSPTRDRLIGVATPHGKTGSSDSMYLQTVDSESRRSDRVQDRDQVQAGLVPRTLAQHTLVCRRHTRQVEPGTDRILWMVRPIQSLSACIL